MFLTRIRFIKKTRNTETDSDRVNSLLNDNASRAGACGRTMITDICARSELIE